MRPARSSPAISWIEPWVGCPSPTPLIAAGAIVLASAGALLVAQRDSDEALPPGADLYRIETDDGAWQGGSMCAEWVDPESGEDVAAGDFILLAGEGADDGLYAAMTWGTVPAGT